VPEIDDVQDHWALDERTLAGLLASARVRDPWAGRLRRPNRRVSRPVVEWLKIKAPKGLGTMEHESVRGRCPPEEGAGKK
jgi:hypothetical protein